MYLFLIVVGQVDIHTHKNAMEIVWKLCKAYLCKAYNVTQNGSQTKM